MLDEFFKQLEIQECIHFSNNNEVTLFDLWKIGFDSCNLLYINEKNAYGIFLFSLSPVELFLTADILRILMKWMI